MFPEVHRYLVALPRGKGKVFLSWRLLGDDAPDAAFHVERRQGEGDNWRRVTTEAIVDSTNYLEVTPQGGQYGYRVTGPGEVPSEAVAVDSAAPASMLALDVALDPEEKVAGIALGELRNDGRMGYVLRTIRGQTIWISAFAHDGERLWDIDTKLPAAGGWDRSTQHVPYLCWDVNADGRTEVVFRRDRQFSGAETHEATGADETMIAVDGETGEVVWERPWPGKRPREMMTVGHLRGGDQSPDLVLLDETYNHLGSHPALTAIDGKSGKTTWHVEQARAAGHNLDIADIDGDGVQEVICGGICYNGDGTVRWRAEPFGHTDISKPARIDPSRDGLQIWYAVESDNPGVYFVDNQGRTIFKEAFGHAHYGWVARHTAKVPGLQPHTAEDSRNHGSDVREKGHFPIFLPDGTHWGNLTEWQRKNFVPVHWDAGPEVVFIIRKENKRIVRLLETGEIQDVDCSKLPEGGRYGRNLPCADVIGDFRENVVAVDTERHRLMVLVNPNPCRVRGYSPFDDFEYRHDRSQHGSGYYVYLSPPETIVKSR